MNWLADVIRYILDGFKRIFPIPPFYTLRIEHVNRGLSCWWSVSKQKNGKELMQVVGDFLVTNLTNQTVFFSHALLNKKKRIKGTVFAGGFTGRSATAFLLPNQTEECRVVFLVSPPLGNIGKTYIDDISIVDNFGNKYWHWLRRCRFECS